MVFHMATGNGLTAGKPSGGDARPLLPPHLSNSQLNGLLACAHRYYLERLLKVDAPSLSAWWFVGGSTVHKLAERFELRRLGVAA